MAHRRVRSRVIHLFFGRVRSVFVANRSVSAAVGLRCAAVGLRFAAVGLRSAASRLFEGRLG